MKKNFHILFLFLPFFLFLCFPPSGSAFGRKSEAQKQIDALNEELKNWGEKGDLQKAIDTAEKILGIARKEFGPKSLETSKALVNAGNLYMYNNNAAEAELLYKQAILIEAKKKGKDSLDIADTYYNLAMAYAAQSKYPQARKLLNDALKIRTKEQGGEHPDTVKVQKMLSELWDRGRSLS